MLQMYGNPLVNASLEEFWRGFEVLYALSAWKMLVKQIWFEFASNEFVQAYIFMIFIKCVFLRELPEFQYEVIFDTFMNL